ncbi:MAG: glutamate 5-kinase [Sedimentisphaerales bacterium]|nr:glutamate 5-kinase [Sedimentisphaerales bacterium]
MRDFNQVKRVVVKVGTNLLSGSVGGVDAVRLDAIARELSAVTAGGRQCILVTSGAIGMGRAAMNIKHKVSDVTMRQALAAIGQGILMHEYQKAFERYGQKVAQVLLTNRIMSHRKYYVNLKNAVEKLLQMRIIPIVNENDCVSIEEIDLAFGDNDKLSALVAGKIDAGLLIILTDVGGLHNANPRTCPDAQRIETVYEITDDIRAMAGKAGTSLGTGGMLSKLAAIEIAANGGCRVVLTDGCEENVIARILGGEPLGTLFLPRRRLSNRKRWILNTLPEGAIHIDAGAARAVADHRSLLAVGITGVEGNFAAGTVVRVGDVAKGVTTLSATQLRNVMGQQNASAQGAKSRAVVHANDMVLLKT